MNHGVEEPAGNTGAFHTRRYSAEGAADIEWPGVPAPGPGETQWLHLDRTDPIVGRWLLEESGIDPVSVDALLERDPRPRYIRTGDTVLLILRTANLNPGSEPEELVSVRIWAEPGRILVLRNRRCAALAAFEEQLPTSTVAADVTVAWLLSGLVIALVDAIEPVVEEVEEQQDQLEDQLITRQHRELAERLGEHRREVLQLHRYLAPQREVLLRLDNDRPPWLTKRERNLLREAANAGARYLEDLVVARDHGALLQEELSARMGDHLNRRLYLFTLIASIFLPLTFFTGLLGSNVDGIPFASREWAFGVVVVICAAIATMQWWLIRSRWID